jgi:hypothetical protein
VPPDEKATLLDKIDCELFPPVDLDDVLRGLVDWQRALYHHTSGSKIRGGGVQ